MSCNNCAVKMSDYNSDNLYTWCTNCGNYGIHGALKRALVAEQIAPKDALLCFDIGCNGNGSDKINGYRFHGLHGRVLPFAAGAAIANPVIKVIASGGDGATLGEGINHLIHTIRSDFNFVFILHNNSNYALTTGQASATTPKGQPMSIAPRGSTIEPINVGKFVLELGGTYFARGYSGNVKQLTSIIQDALKHNGFAFVEVLQDCPTYNKFTNHDWYMEHIYDIGQVKSYDSSSAEMAKVVVKDLSERVATGVLYRNGESIDFLNRETHREEYKTTLVEEVKSFDIAPLLESFR